MKRGIVTLILLALLISPMILAPEEETILPTEDDQVNIKEQLSTLKGGLDDTTENVLKREIQVPKELQIPLKIILGIDDTYAITIERFVVLLGIWMMFFFLIQGILKLMPFLNKGWQSSIASIIITTLIAITGMINSIAIFYFNLGNTFEWLEALGPFQIVIAIAIVVLILFITHHVLKIVERKILLTEAKDSGESIGGLVATAKATEESIKNLTK